MCLIFVPFNPGLNPGLSPVAPPGAKPSQKLLIFAPFDPGLTVAEMKCCPWIEPSIVCEVKFTEWTRDDRLGQPVFLGLREDKNAAELVREEPNDEPSGRKGGSRDKVLLFS
jgi:hypothetical protein